MAKLIAEKADNTEITNSPNMLAGKLRIGKPIKGKMNLPRANITINWSKATNR